MTTGKTFYGWYVVAACAVGLACGLPSVITATFPIFLAPLRAEFSWTQPEAFAALFVTTLTVTIAAPFFGALVDRIGAKRMIIAGLLLEALVLASYSLQTASIVEFYVRYAVLAVLGLGTTHVAFTRVISVWFNRRRGLALGLTLAGLGIGGFGWPLIAQWSIENVGWRDGYLPLPFYKSGVAKVVEYGARLAGHQKKLSSQFSEVTDIIREANYWAKKAGSSVVQDSHVEKALQEKVYRNSRIEERIQEMIVDGTIIVDTKGEKIGQINGLAVLDMGDYMFGKPSRITAKTFAGKAGLVNIERETKMSGKIHEKAILIISNYIHSTYAGKKPISFSASITFEQLYEMIEGDSASCAELYVILSSLANVPLKQNLAITGSMDQHGDVQPIGGVNEKIEGFFDLCKVRGLDGTHGVVIPRKNMHNLMLKKEVVDAVKDGKFSIYAISRVEEGLELFTGMESGEQKEDGSWPEGTVSNLVMKRFDDITQAFKERDKKEKKEDEKKQEWNLERIEKVLSLLGESWPYIMRILHSVMDSIKIQEIRLDLKLGLESPADTAIVTGYIWAFTESTRYLIPPSLNISVNPDFENKILDGFFNLKLKFRLYGVTKELIRALTKKPVRSLICEMRG